MSINNYEAIKGAIADWLTRDDLNGRIDDFLTICQVQLARRLKAVDMENIGQTPLLAGQQYYGLPDRLTEFRNIYINTNPLTKLVYRTPDQLIVEYPWQNGGQVAYTLVDGQIKLNSPPGDQDSTEGAVLETSLITSYWAYFEYLSTANPTNWLTEEAPDLLLYGSLIAAEMYLGSDERMPMWKESYKEELAAVNFREDRKRYGGAPLEQRAQINGSYSQPIRVR